MYARLISALLLSLCAVPLAPRIVRVDAAAPASQLPLCGPSLTASRPRAFPPVLHVGARPVPAALSERTGRTFVALSGQRGTGGGISLGCRSSVTTIDTVSGRLLGRVPAGVIPGAIAVDDQDGRVFVTGLDESSYPAKSGPALAILDTQGQIIKPAGAFAPCPCANEFMSTPIVATDGAIHRAFAILLGSVVTFDALTGARLGNVPADTSDAGGVDNFAVDTRHHRLYVATGAGVTVIDGRTGALAQTINLGESKRAIAEDSRTDRLFVGQSNGCPYGHGGPATSGVIVFAATRGKRVNHILGSCVGGLLVDEPARRVLAELPGGSTGHFKYAVLDAANGKVLRTLTLTWPLENPTTAVEPGNGRIYTVFHGSIHALDPLGWRDAGRILLPAGSGARLSISVTSRTHRLLVTDRERGRVLIFSTLAPTTG
jgi:DNA-binding beta-propeller fold protein YncE